MEFHIGIDMCAVMRWNINIQQAAVFAYATQAARWADRCPEDAEYFNLSNGKLATELPPVSDKRDTMLRHVMALVESGVIERKTWRKKQYLRITEKGHTWNQLPGVIEQAERENYPASSEERDKYPASTGKIIPVQREENPASSEERDKYPEGTGFSSDVSVNQLSIKNNDLVHEPVDNFVDPKSERGPELHPPTVDERIDRMKKMLLEHGWNEATFSDDRSYLVMENWLRLGIGQNQLLQWIKVANNANHGKPVCRPVLWLEQRVNEDLQVLDQADEQLKRLKETKKGRSPEEVAKINAALGRTAIKPKSTEVA